MLSAKNIVLGVAGSIAAYKAADLASKLVQAQALVDVIVTDSAARFVTPLTFRSLTHRPVVTDLFDPYSELSVEHVALAERADAVVIAPATANILARIAHGMADDALTCTVLATRAPVIVAPAMDGNMYESPATAQNLATLKERGVVQVGPKEGRLASGLVGMGRMAETPEIIDTLRKVLGRDGDLKGRKVVVTAGGTHEPIDPVRVITNRSSGKMGYAVAEAARDRGASVTLVTTPVAIRSPGGVDIVEVRTAREMAVAVAQAVMGASALVMAAAVADFEAVDPAGAKIKKGSGSISVELRQTPDILGQVKGPFVRVGFAAESEDLVQNARAKLEAKGLDLIVGNDITATDSGFSVDTNRVVILGRNGARDDLPLMLKYDVAQHILDRVVTLLRSGDG